MSAITSKRASSVFSITKPSMSQDLELCNGVTNSAYSTSTSDLPTIFFQQEFGKEEMMGPDSVELGLAVSDSDGNSSISSAEYDDTKLHSKCEEHKKVADNFCVDCLAYICNKCHMIHHAQHQTVSCESLSGKPPAITEAYTRCIEKAETYHSALTKELGSLDNTLTDAINDVEAAFEPVLQRVSEMKSAAILKVKATVSAQRQAITERIESNQQSIDGYNIFLETGVWSSDILENSSRHSPMTQLIVPNTSLEVKLNMSELSVPEIDIKLTTSASCIPAEPPQQKTTKLTTKHISTVGAKGNKDLQFKLPGGVCVDKDNNVYVADEGNNRIQRINRYGRCIGTFTWGKTDCFITDVAYDPSTDRLIVPRAHSEHGLLKCSSFSYVTLDGCEVSRFVVPSMQGGLFVSCNKNGDVLISDVVKKSVFMIKDGHVHLEINDLDHLKQPAHCTFGRDGDILVVDSARRVIAVYDDSGLYIRDIGAAGTEANELRKPSGVSIDRSCAIVAVTDWCGDKVVVYSYYGDVITIIHGFKCPHSVMINNNHRLVVTDCWNNQLKVFSYTE